MMDIPVSLATIVECLPDSPFKEKVSEVRAAVLSRIAELEHELAAAQAREKVLHSLSNELLHQIDINDFMDSHGHDLMRILSQAEGDNRPLQKLGARLAELLDEDQWAECEAMLLSASVTPEQD